MNTRRFEDLFYRFSLRPSLFICERFSRHSLLSPFFLRSDVIRPRFKCILWRFQEIFYRKFSALHGSLRQACLILAGPLVTVFILLASLISFTLAKNCIRGAGDRGCAAAAGEYAPTAAAPAVGAAERRSTAGAWSSDSRSGATKSIASVWISSHSSVVE